MPPASTHALAARARRDARQNRRLRRALTGIAVLLVAALVGGLIAYQQRQTAQRSERVAQREEREAALTALTSSAAALRSNRLDLAALLAVEAHRMAPSAATRSALFGTFTSSPGLMRIVHTDLETTGVNLDVSVLPDTDVMVVQDAFGGADVIDTTTGVRRHLEGPVEEPGYAWLLVSADGRYAASIWNSGHRCENDADNYGVLTAWELRTGERRFEPVRIPFAAARMAISADGSMVAASAVRVGSGLGVRRHQRRTPHRHSTRSRAPNASMVWTRPHRSPFSPTAIWSSGRWPARCGSSTPPTAPRSPASSRRR